MPRLACPAVRFRTRGTAGQASRGTFVDNYLHDWRSTMLTIHGRKHASCCDGITRRDVLRIGAFGLGTLALPDLFRMEAMAGPAAQSSKALINIYLGGGPPQMDMFDLKPDAPSGIRGEFRPIKTNVSGMEICELMP